MRKILVVLAVFILLTVAGVTTVLAQSGVIQFGTDVQFTDVVSFEGAVTNNSTLAQVGASTFTGNATFAGTTSVTGASTLTGGIAGDLHLVPATSITVTVNGYITPTGTLQELTAAGNVATANIAAGTEGDLLILYNSSNTTITFTDTGTLKLSGNTALSQFDSVTLVSDGTNWLELAQGDASP